MSDTFLTVRQCAQKHPWASEAALRSYIFEATTNGFDVVVRRIGRKILLKEQELLRWIDSERGAK